ncbi:MAG: serine hydrolase domain-containing protein [Caulobacter sp.]|nr:serine hydrolase domain-containing protein [Caulobacter sp.]
MNRRHLLASLSALGLAPTLPACAQEPEAQGVNALQVQTGAPALAGAVVGVKGIQLIEFAGVRRLGEVPMVGPAEVWHLGSNSKAMTAALYGRLVDQGKARWGATLGQLFEGLTLDPAFAPMPIEALMGHRSGVLDQPVMMGGFLLKAHKDSRPLTAQRAEVAAQLLAKPPAGTVGNFAYSNVNYILVGAAIERITGQGWEEAITAQLFKPLAMTSAGFGAPKGNNAWGHRPLMGVAGPLKPVDPAGMADNPPILGPAGTVHSNLTDYAKFLRLFLTDGGDVLKPATVRALTTPVPGEGRPYALGWGISTPPWAQGPVLAHEGSNTMWHAVALVAPGRKLAFVGVANGPPDATKGAARSFAGQFRKRFIPD